MPPKQRAKKEKLANRKSKLEPAAGQGKHANNPHVDKGDCVNDTKGKGLAKKDVREDVFGSKGQAAVSGNARTEGQQVGLEDVHQLSAHIVVQTILAHTKVQTHQ